MKQTSHFFDGFFLEWQEVVASVHVSRETGLTFLIFFWGGRRWWRPCMSPEK